MNHFSRRTFLGAVATAAVGCRPKVTELEEARRKEAARILSEIESRILGRVGVYAIATDSGAVLTHRCRERFAMCSTFKWVLAAAILAQVDRKKLSLAQAIEFGDKDLLDYAPVTRKNLSRGRMSIGELAEAAVTLSDNTSANLLLERVGGPQGLTQFLRGHGDNVTRLDRNEPTLNTNEAHDPRDTTTPEAMVATMRALLVNPTLAPSSLEILLGWMVACQTGNARLRAGLPSNWRVGDKTGSGANGAVNDIAIAWPPKRAPILIAVYLSESASPQPVLNAAHAEIGRLVATMLT